MKARIRNPGARPHVVFEPDVPLGIRETGSSADSSD
jgi:hypothetical protein